MNSQLLPIAIGAHGIDRVWELFAGICLLGVLVLGNGSLYVY